MVFAPMSTAELRDLLGSAAEQADEILAKHGYVEEELLMAA